MRFSLHSTLGNLVQMTTYTCYPERDFALVQLVMAPLTERQEIGQSVFAAMSTEDEMMGFQFSATLTAVLTPIPIAHQTGHAQILIQPCRILVLTSLEVWVVQTSNIHLDVLDDKRTDREGKTPNGANDFLHIRFNRRGQPSAPLARCAVEKACRPIPATRSAAFAPITSIIHLLFDIPAVMDRGSKQDPTIAHAGKARNTAAFIDPTRDFLNVPFTLEAELDCERTIVDNFGFPGL
jgi:hypothetical protein